MGDGVNIAARLEGIAEPGAICLSEDAYRQVSGRLDMAVTDLGPTQLKNIARSIRVYSLQVGVPVQAKPAAEAKPAEPKKRSSLAPLALGLATLVVSIAAGAWYFLGANRPRCSPQPRPRPSPRTPGRPKPRIFPSSCCLSQISLAIRARTISPTASPKISPPICRAFAAASSSRATPPLHSRARALTRRKSARSLTCAMCSKARSSAIRPGCASTRN